MVFTVASLPDPRPTLHLYGFESSFVGRCLGGLHAHISYVGMRHCEGYRNQAVLV